MRATPAEKWVLDELKEVGRELIEEPVPSHLLALLQTEEDQQS